MNENFVPCGKLLLVRMIDTTEKRSAHGIIITTNDESPVARGTVVSIGDYDESNPISPGDIVIFAKYAGVVVQDDLRIMKPEDVLAKVMPKAHFCDPIFQQIGETCKPECVKVKND